MNLDEIKQIKNKIPNLKIDNKALPKELQQKKYFTIEDIRPLVRTSSRLNENIIELPSWDDAQLLNGVIPPWGFIKFIEYEIKHFGIGQVEVILRFGEKRRKPSDFRFFEVFNVEEQKYNFIYNLNTNLYEQINPENSDEWKNRTSIINNFEAEVLEFIWHFLKVYKYEFLEAQSSFKKKTNARYKEIKEYYIKSIEFFNYATIYLEHIHIIYGDICNDEYYYLRNGIKKLIDKVTITLKYLENFNEMDYFDSFLDYKNKNDETNSIGNILDTNRLIEHFSSTRKEQISEDSMFAYNVNQGYVNKIDTLLIPTIFEIERRRSLYHDASNKSQEDAIKALLIRKIK